MRTKASAPRRVFRLIVDVAVIGAGVFGSWTAWQLAHRGLSVLLVDAWGPGHSRSSSGGESRIIRMGYGADELYTRMAMRSLPQWEQALRGKGLFQRTGVLWIARARDAHSEATRETLVRAGVPIEVLSATDIARRFPQMRLEDADAFGIFEPESGALLARRAVAAVVEEAVREGVAYCAGAVQRPAGRGTLTAVRLADGEEIVAGEFVFACGPWLPKLFPALLGNRIHPTRQEVLFFAPPSGDRRFAPPQLPVWIEFIDARGPYGFPDLEGRGFKLAFDRHGPAFDPDSGERWIAPEAVSTARAYLAERFPALRDAPLTEARVCQYENTCNGDFLIDRHPDFSNVWLVGGGSGHGFKHGPAVGEYVAARMLDGIAAEPRFSVAGKSEVQRRTVY